MTLISIHLVSKHVRFETDPSGLDDNNYLPAAYVSTPPGRFVVSQDGNHAIRMNARDYSAAEVFAGDCYGANVTLLLSLSPTFSAIAGWEPNPGMNAGLCPRCWKRTEVVRPKQDQKVVCERCNTQLIVRIAPLGSL